MILSSISSETWLVGILIPVILGTVVVVQQSKTRAQRDFFIKEFDSLKDEYKDFIKGIRDAEKSAEAIKDGFNSFSKRIKMLLEELDKEYVIENCDLFERHGQLQMEVGDFESISNQYRDNVVHLNPDEKSRMDEWFVPLYRSFIRLIVKINRASIAYSSWFG